MRRWVVLTLGVMMVGVLGGVASTAAGARTPGRNGRITFGQDTKDCDDCISGSG